MSDTATAPEELAKLDAQSSARFAAFRAVDRRGLDEWGRDNIIMGEGWSAWPGRFDPSITPMICEPLRRLGGTGPRRVTILGPAAGSKSTIGEVLIAWVIDNAPGLTVWFTETIDTAKEFAESRLNRVLAACPRVASWFVQMARHAKRTQEIHFPHMSLLVRAANETQAQSKHIRHMVCDETWRYPTGMLAMLHKRTTRFAHNRTILELSTGSLAGDETDEAFGMGSRQEWQVYCPACKTHHVPRWSFGKDKPGGVKWSPLAKRADGSWNFRIVIESAYYECPLCSAQYAANAANGYALNHAGKFTDPHPDTVPNHWSFRWNCIATDFAQLGTVAVEYLLAKAAAKRGMMTLLQEFTQKKLAEAWKEIVTDADITQALATGYKMGEAWADEFLRFMTVDVQATHMWCVVRAWSKAQEARLAWAGRVESFGEVREMQLRHGVQDQRVLIDSGDFTDAVYTECAFYGWYAIKGEPAERGYRRDLGGGRFASELAEFSGGNAAHSRTKYFPVKPRQGGKANWCHMIKVSDSLSSDVLGAMRGGTAGWTAANDAPQDWREQMAAVVKSQVANKKTGRMEWIWKTIAKCGEHLWDCERYQLAAAVMSGVLKISTQPKTEEDKKEEKAA